MKAEAVRDVTRIFVEEGQLIDEALKQGFREAVLRHKKDGVPMAIYRDGKTVWIDPSEFDV